MSQDTTVTVKDYALYAGAGLLVCVLLVASFGLGMVYQRITSRFQYHEIPLKSGGIAFIVPEKWQVVTEWDKTGRPYIKPSDEAE